MRSQSFLRKSRVLVKRSAAVHNLQVLPLLQSRLSCTLQSTRSKTPACRRTQTRLLSTSSSPPAVSTTASAVETANDPPEASNNTVPVEETEKPSIKIRRTRGGLSSKDSNSASSSKDSDVIEFREGLDNEILFAPSQSLAGTLHSVLPPPEILEEALDKLLITLHPQNQARAMLSPSSSSHPIEPTLAFYCPIEGGDNYIDYTVHELAFRTGSEVLVLDAVQLAAGEWGIFGKAANALNLSPNPLHFSSSSRTQPSELNRRRSTAEDDRIEEVPFMMAPPSRMSIAKAFSPLPSRIVMSPSSRKPEGPSKLDLFFEALVNMPCPEDSGGSAANLKQSRPRLIYIRDFPTLAPSSSSWYPSLLNAVRQRRRGLLARSSNFTSTPATIIFGMSPSIAHPSPDSSSASRSSLMSLFMNRTSIPSQLPQDARSENVQDFTETEIAQAAREKRLRRRLRKWDKNPAALQEEFSKLQTRAETRDRSPSPGIIVIGGAEGTSPVQSEGITIGLSVSDSDETLGSQFFRSAVLIPLSRSPSNERAIRMARRREINELTIRMGVGSIGGAVEPPFITREPPEGESQNSSTLDPFIWEEWGNKIEIWSNVRKVADRAIGSVMVQQNALDFVEKPPSTLTVVPWSAVESAWVACMRLDSTRSSWLTEHSGYKMDDDQDDGGGKIPDAPGSSSDKVVENLKKDPDLDEHTARLLPCIVNTNSLTTTFSQVHLPSQTIDAVRTIVSLPLLHPQAFSQGILKEHGMTGCLLFGPPGTGKTLVVRALAKEAGCRMLMVSPSDVMDMYVGEGEKLVRAVFSLARKLSPCVVFLDEIDALFGARMSARESGSAFAYRGVITEFMQEMDGLKASKDNNVIVIGATNRPFDLDDAVLRRLPRRLLVDLPGEKERGEILKILLRDEFLAADVNIAALAKRTEGFSGSDLKHLCVSAALDSVKEHIDLPWVSRHTLNAVKNTVPGTTLLELEKSEENVKDVTASVLGINKDVETVESTSNNPGEHIQPAETDQASLSPRVLHLRHFTQALKEITPSSSEALGSLADLRKWNEEFGEGRRDRKTRQVWGKGRFGFINAEDDILEDGRVAK